MEEEARGRFHSLWLSRPVLDFIDLEDDAMILLACVCKSLRFPGESVPGGEVFFCRSERDITDGI